MGADTQEPQDRRQQILDAAARVFSVKGFRGATNKDIAEEAGGISPGLIYHYFKDKQDLFLSIIAERMEILQIASHPEEFMDRPPREVLTMLGGAYLGMLQKPANLALFRMVIGEIFRFPEIAAMFERAVISRVFAVAVRYLERQIELGRLRPHNPAIGIRTFIGGIIAHILLREIFRQPDAIATPDDVVVRQVVDTFLNGLAADQQDGGAAGA